MSSTGTRFVLCILLTLALCGAAYADPVNLVVNGDFSNGGAGWSVNYAAQNSFFGFGDGYAAFGATSPGYLDQISQTLATTAGKSEVLTFSLTNEYAYNTAEFQVIWDGKVIADILPSSPFGSKTYTFLLTGTGSDTLSFAGYNAPGWFELRDVSVTTPVAEPALAALLLLGLGGVSGVRWRVRHRD